jgi:predicted amidohydrolase YtcJ
VNTADGGTTVGGALDVGGDSSIAVGNTADARRLSGSAHASPRARHVCHLGLRSTRTHVHVQATGALLAGANLLDVHEPKAFAERIAAAAARLPNGRWIMRGDHSGEDRQRPPLVAS